jgi:hypothetical protein
LKEQTEIIYQFCYPEKNILEEIKEMKEIPYYITISLDKNDCEAKIYNELSININIKKFKNKKSKLMIYVKENEQWSVIGRNKIIEEFDKENCEKNVKIILLPLIDGFIFHGSADGSVAVIRSYDNIYPIEISYDHGKTFQPFDTSGHFEDFAKNDIDLKWRLMKLGMYNDFDKCPDYFTDGFARVKKNGKYNYLYRKNYTHGVISPDVWFDSAPPTFDKQGIARVQVN